MNWKTVILAIFGMGAMVAIIHPSSLETPTPASTPAAKTATKTVVVRQAAVKPDGYISEAACAQIQGGMAVSDLVFKYGWPASDYGFSNFTERFFYPVHDAGEDRCVIDFDDNKVVSALYRDE